MSRRWPNLMHLPCSPSRVLTLLTVSDIQSWRYKHKGNRQWARGTFDRTKLSKTYRRGTKQIRQPVLTPRGNNRQRREFLYKQRRGKGWNRIAPGQVQLPLIDDTRGPKFRPRGNPTARGIIEICCWRDRKIEIRKTKKEKREKKTKKE